MPQGPSDWSVDGNGARMSVRVWQAERESRGAVCMLHGLGEHSRRSLHVGRALASRGFTVVAPDWRGHGLSSGKRGHAASVNELLDDVSLVLAAADRELGASRWMLYGHSMGGAIALAHALRRPDTIAACVATGPAIRTAFTPPAWKVAFGRAVRRMAPALTLHNEVPANGLSHVESVTRDYRADPLVHDRISAALGISLLDAGGELLAAAPGLTVPTLIVHGGEDVVTSARASREFAGLAGPICRYVEVAGAFHEVHHETSWDETWRVIDEWINTTIRAPAH